MIDFKETLFPFGEYAGKGILYIPSSYLEWAMEEGNLNSYLRSAITSLLEWRKRHPYKKSIPTERLGPVTTTATSNLPRGEYGRIDIVPLLRKILSTYDGEIYSPLLKKLCLEGGVSHSSYERKIDAALLSLGVSKVRKATGYMYSWTTLHDVPTDNKTIVDAIQLLLAQLK